MDLKGKKIGFAITASFCTVQEILLPMEKLSSLGADLYPVVSENVNAHSSRFHDRNDYVQRVSEICGRGVVYTIAQAENFGPVTQLDLMIIAPATGTTMAKLAHGISDGAVTMATKATLRNGSPVLIAPFSNDALGANGINIMKLYNTKNIFFVPFGQDDSAKKPNSLAADLMLLPEAAICALDGKQLQPALITF